MKEPAGNNRRVFLYGLIRLSTQRVERAEDVPEIFNLKRKLLSSRNRLSPS